jgi:hypothetical protein
MATLRLPIILNPLQPVTELGDLTVALVSVELWPLETVVRLAGLVEDQQAEDRAFGARLSEWARGGRHEPMPKEPGSELRRLELALADDLGSTYGLRVGMTGGSGRPYRGDWIFEGGVPERAGQLELTVTGDRTSTVSLRIARP